MSVLHWRDMATILLSYGFMGLVSEIQSTLTDRSAGGLKAIREAREYLAARDFARKVAEQYRSNEREGLEGKTADALREIAGKLKLS